MGNKYLIILGLFILLLGFVSASEFQLDENTVALWHFNEGSGNTVFDETSNNNDGAISGSTWTTEGKFGNALNFDGIGDKISVPFSSSIGELPNLTLEAWVKRNSQGDGMVISKNGPYFLSVRNNVVEGGVYAGPGWIHVNGISELEINEWYHIALTYDGSFVKIYLNGTEDGSKSKTGGILITGQGLHIGWGEPGHNQYFNGTIDEVRISNISRNNFNVTEPPEKEPSLEERIGELEERVDELENRVSVLERVVNKIKKFIKRLPRGLSKRWN